MPCQPVLNATISESSAPPPPPPPTQAAFERVVQRDPDQKEFLQVSFYHSSWMSVHQSLECLEYVHGITC